MKFLKYLFLSFLGVSLLPLTIFSQQIPTLDFFHGRECPHCQNEKKWFPTLRQAYPDIIINEYEVWHDTENQALWAKRLEAIGQSPSGVPSNLIGDQQITGFAPDRILAALEAEYGPPSADIRGVEPTEEENDALDMTLILIVLVGLGIAGGFAFLGKKS